MEDSGERISTAMVLDEPNNGDWSEAHAREVLVSGHKQSDIVLIDTSLAITCPSLPPR